MALALPARVFAGMGLNWTNDAVFIGAGAGCGGGGCFGWAGRRSLATAHHVTHVQQRLSLVPTCCAAVNFGGTPAAACCRAAGMAGGAGGAGGGGGIRALRSSVTIGTCAAAPMR